MMLNKSEFENGLKQDIKVFGGPNLFQNPSSNQAKPNLFGPTPNLIAGGYQMNNEGAPPQNFEAQGKSKRDLLWEQKMKEKQQLINPSIGGGASLLDQMNPHSRQALQGLKSNKQNEFQKATSFDQPKTLIELQPSIKAPSQQQQQQQQMVRGNTPQSRQRDLNIPPQQHSFQINETPLIIKKESINLWDQMQVQQPQNQPMNQFNDQFFYQAPSPQYQNAQLPPQMNFEEQVQLRPPQNYQQVMNQPQPQYEMMPPQQQYNMPASQPSSNQQQPAQSQQMILQQQEEKKQKQKEYLIQMQNDIKEKEEKKRREKEDRIRKEREELKKNQDYNPFGKGGSGAPMKDVQGNVMVNRKPMGENQMPPQQQQRQYGGQQQQNYNQQFLPAQNMMGPTDVYVHQQQYPNNQNYPIMQNQPLQSPMMDQFQQYMPPQMQMPQQQVQQFPQANFQAMQLPIQQSIDPILSPPMNFGNQQKMRAPDPSFQLQQQNQPQPSFIKNDPYKDQDEQNDNNNGLGIGAYNEIDKDRQKNKKQELNNILKQQMEEQKRRKEEEQRKKKEEELREEERIRKERQKIEDQFKQEEMKSKQKINEIQQANAQLIQQKNAKPSKPMDDGPVLNYVVEKGKNLELFGNNPAIDMNQRDDGPPLQRQSTFEGGPGNPQINQTRIINEISHELKNNFKEEIGKLRDEMNSQQRQFREQLDRLKGDALKSNSEKSEAISEIEKVKAEIKAQREMERLQEQKLFSALDKYNPNKPIAPMEMLNNYDKPGAFPAAVKDQQYNSAIPSPYGMPAAQNNINMNNSFYNNRKLGGSRQESRESQRKKEINNYEKMFFNNNNASNDPAKKSQSQSRDGMRKPEYNIKEEKMVNFNQDYFQPAYDYNQNNGGRYEPKIMKRADSAINNIDFGASLNAESTLLPFSQQSNAKDQIQPNQQLFNPQPLQQQQKQTAFNPVYDDKFKNKENKQNNGTANNYLDHLNNMGAGDVRLNTESEDTMDFVNRIVNGKRKDPDDQISKLNNGKKEERLAEKFDDFNFNFPSIPAYEGFQQNILKLDKPQDLSRPNYNQPIQRDQKQADVFARNFGNNAGSIKLTDNTMHSIGTLNSINLDNLNQKNDDRIAKLGLAFDALDMTQNTQVNIGDNFQFSPEKPQYQQQQRQQPSYGNSNDELKQYDSVLADLLRGSDNNGGQGNLNLRVNSSGGRIPHINQSNNYQNLQKMRDTKDQFMVPKMGQIYEDGGEDYDGTFKNPKAGAFDYKGIGGGYQLPNDMRRLDQLLDTTNLALD